MRRAFSLLELLAVVAILGILVGLSLPAVQQIRESARKTACQNNVRQLGIAALNYESAKSVYPPGQLCPVPQVGVFPDFMSNQLIGHLGFLLPYLESESHVQSFQSQNWNVNAYGPAWILNPTLLSNSNSSISSLKCPSDQMESPQLVVVSVVPLADSDTVDYVAVNTDDNYLGWTNYLGCSGDVLKSGNFQRQKGVFFARSKIKSRDILDGFSSTIFFGELIGGTKNFFGDILGQAKKRHSFLSNGLGCKYGFFEGIELFTNEDESLFCYSSRHTGHIAYFSFGDGSTRGIPRSIDLDLLANLMTRNGGEVTELEW